MLGRALFGHYILAGIVISLAAALGSFVLLDRLAKERLGTDGARRTVLYLAVFPMALFLQAAVFGIAHGYQGLRNCVAIAIYGALFTLLALWRKSLRPGMIAHAWTDIAAGLLR